MDGQLLLWLPHPQFRMQNHCIVVKIAVNNIHCILYYSRVNTFNLYIINDLSTRLSDKPIFVPSFIAASLASEEAFLVAFHQRLSERKGKSARKAHTALLCMID